MALSFLSDADSRVLLGANSNLDNVNFSFAIASLVYIVDFSATGNIASKGSQKLFRVHTDGSFELIIARATTNRSARSAASILTTDTWYYLVTVVSSGGLPSLYWCGLDGNLQEVSSYVTQTVGAGTVTAENSAWHIGNQAASGSRFRGNIEYVHYYKTGTNALGTIRANLSDNYNGPDVGFNVLLGIIGNTAVDHGLLRLSTTPTNTAAAIISPEIYWIGEDFDYNSFDSGGSGDETANITGLDIDLELGDSEVNTNNPVTGQELGLELGTATASSVTTATVSGLDLDLELGIINELLNQPITGLDLSLTLAGVDVHVTSNITGQDISLTLGTVVGFSGQIVDVTGLDLNLALGSVIGNISSVITGQDISLALGDVTAADTISTPTITPLNINLTLGAVTVVLTGSSTSTTVNGLDITLQLAPTWTIELLVGQVGQLWPK